MNYETEKLINCSEFENSLTDYLDKSLESKDQKACAAHALRCPICHDLLNSVKISLAACVELPAPKVSLIRLEAKILSRTMPETEMHCYDFEENLTNYLDGFLPAAVFHRWERHAVLCPDCENLPGEVVRSLATLVSFKAEELPVPSGLHNRILQETIGTVEAKTKKASAFAQVGEWIRGLSIPISIPQLAPVVIMLAFAFFVVTQTASADGSVSGVYRQSFMLAEQTYQQSAQIVLGEKTIANPQYQEPTQGTYVNEETRK
jgi:hypothetical protein